MLVARPAPCLRCRGVGSLPCVSCAFCGLFEPAPRGPWYLPEQISGDCFPSCGHAVGFLSAKWGAFVCPDCGKDGCEAGQVQVWKTAAEWARQDVREARERKQAASEAAQLLSESGTRCGFSGRQVRRMLGFLAPKCEAHCKRTGKPCPKRVVLGNVRCRLHGGLSAGPATAAGRARISESNRRRAGEKLHAE